MDVDQVPQATDRAQQKASALPAHLRFPQPNDSVEDAPNCQLVRLAGERGYQAALESELDEANRKYVSNPARLTVLELPDIQQSDDLLEIGASLGQMTVELATRAKSVTAIEVSPRQAYFLHERCKQQELDNVSVHIGGDDCRLPFPDASFDVVIFNLVFEWCATRLPDESFQAGQQRMLNEISRVLRPGGRMLLNTKNRYALMLLIGKRDPHLFNLRFGNALPRFIANLLTAKKQKKEGRLMGRLYSFRKLNRMIREAGFETIQNFWLAPEMRFPNHAVETTSTSINELRRKAPTDIGEFRSTRWIMKFLPAFLVKHLTPGLCNVATKPS